MKSELKPGSSVKFAPAPAHGRYEHLCVRRADLISLISEMECNQRLQAAAWQIESLRRSLQLIEQQLSHARESGGKGRTAPASRKPFHFTKDGSHNVGLA